MNRVILSCILLLLFVSNLKAQTHTGTGTWTLSTDDTTTACAVSGANCAQNVYRAPGTCSSTSVFTRLQSLSATATTFSDTTITPGTYCYAVTFVINGSESVVFLSGNTNFATVTLPPKAQTGFSVTAN